jgi:hypothetical protein
MKIPSPFQKDPREKLENQLQSERAAFDGNAKRLRDAEARLVEARKKVDESALLDDAKALDSALANRRSIEDLVGALSAASGKIATEVSAIELQIEQERDRVMRHETAEAIKDIAGRLDASASAFGTALSEYVSALREASLATVEAHAFIEYAEALKSLVPDTARVIEGLRLHRQAVLSGGAPASLPRPAPEPVPLKLVPSEPTQNIFVLQNLKYVAANGSIVVCGRNRRHDLPQRLATLAIDSHMALPLSERKKFEGLEGTSGAFEPLESSCQWIGPEGRASAPPTMRQGPPIAHSSLTTFEKYDRGPIVVGTMKTAPVEPVAMGACAMPEDEP